jgi:hypothetical protein
MDVSPLIAVPAALLLYVIIGWAAVMGVGLRRRILATAGKRHMRRRSGASR